MARVEASNYPAIRQVNTLVGDPAWLVTAYDDVKALLADPRLGRSHPDPPRASKFSRSAIFGGPTGNPATEATEHAQLRRLLAPPFSVRQMDRLRPRVRQIVAGMLDELLDRIPPADFHEAVSFPLPALVICELLGVPFEDRADFGRWSDDIAHTIDQQRSEAGLRALQQYMKALVERKRDDPGEDVISDLIMASVREGRVDVDGVARLAAGLLYAGHETTAGAIDRGVTLLLTNRAQHAALLNDRSLIPTAVEEILRLSPLNLLAAGDVTGSLARYAKTDIEMHGVTIHGGDLVLLGLRSANQDEQRFSEPNRFDIHRTPNPHLTFGHGPRFCAGAPLARMELAELFTALLARCPAMSLAVPVEDLRPRDELLTGGLYELPVTWPTNLD